MSLGAGSRALEQRLSGGELDGRLRVPRFIKRSVRVSIGGRCLVGAGALGLGMEVEHARW